MSNLPLRHFSRVNSSSANVDEADVTSLTYVIIERFEINNLTLKEAKKENNLKYKKKSIYIECVLMHYVGFTLKKKLSRLMVGYGCI